MTTPRTDSTMVRADSCVPNAAVVPASMARGLESELNDATREIQRLHAELRNIAKAKRFDRQHFDDDTAFADWAQSRARHASACSPPGQSLLSIPVVTDLSIPADEVTFTQDGKVAGRIVNVSANQAGDG